LIKLILDLHEKPLVKLLFLHPNNSENIMRYLTFTVLLLGLCKSLYSQPVYPDTSFSGDGIHTFNFYNNIDRGFGCAVQPDQKIVMVGLSKNPASGAFELCFARYLLNGNLDSTFSGDGKSYVPMGQQQSIGGQSPRIKIQSDGKIVAVNSGRNPNNNSQDAFVCRIDSTGVLDNTFGTAGITYIDMTGNPQWPDLGSALDIDPQGNIYIAGATRNGGTPLDNDFAIAKLTPNGIPDPTFDADGKKLFNLTGMAEFGTGIRVLPSGNIVFGGSAGLNSVIAMIDSTGALVTSFAGTGWTTVTFANGWYMKDLQLDNLSRIVAAGTNNSSSGGVCITRYLDNGTADTTFGTAGKYAATLGGSTNEVSSLVITSENGVLVSGWVTTASFGTDYLVASVDSSGDLDLNFNNTGYYYGQIAQGATNEECNAMAQLADGRIFLSGTLIFSSAINEDVGIMLLKQDASTGLVTLEAGNTTSVYPNPCQTHFRFNITQDAQICLCDISGRVIHSGLYYAGDHQVDVSELAPGMYFLTNALTGNSVRIIKQ
jgi:uncharacterized delta-60 repeat protein